MTKKKQGTELDFDLAAIRDVKRLVNRTVKKIVLIEKSIKRRREDQREAWREKKRAKREKAKPEPTQDAAGVWHNLDIG